MSDIELLKSLAELSQLQGVETNALPPDEFRFLIEYRSDQSLGAFKGAVGELLGTSDFIIAPLFEDADDDLERIVALRFPGVEQTLPQEKLFDIAYALQEELGLVSCEPDITTRFYSDPEPARQGQNLESVDTLASTCWVDTPAPADKYWALKKTGVLEAWQIASGKGSGIIIGQPDTGVADHHELEQGVFRLDLAKNIITGSNDPTDPLDPSDSNPGHGSSTSSVAVGKEAGEIAGSAPGAKLVPIRCIKDVKVFNTGPVAAAVEHARKQGCHIITMSLGGVPGWSLKRAIRKAVKDGVIVLAAAGNCVRLVVYPARFSDVIAVGGTNEHDKIWKGSSRGGDVDFSAPAEMVWRARHDVENGGTPIVSGGQGTSFAVALSAGIAALWLSHHGVDNLKAQAAAKGITLQELFRAAAKSTARRPSGWSTSKLGAGIINAKNLLNQAPSSIPTGGFEAAIASVDNQEIRELIAEATGQWPQSEEFDWQKYENEVAHLIFNDARVGRYSGLPGAESATSPVLISDRLKSAISASDDSGLDPLGNRMGSAQISGYATAVSSDPVLSLPIIARPAGSQLESAGSLSVEGSLENLTDNRNKALLDKLEKVTSSGQVDNQFKETAKEFLESAERALSKLRSQGASTKLTHGERIGLEALVEIDGRPVLAFEDGSLDVNNPLLETWQGDVVLQLQQLEELQSSVGRINLDGRHIGTGFVVADGLIMTNRHVVEQFRAAPVPTRFDPQKWIMPSKNVSIDFSDAGSSLTSNFKIKSVVYAGPNPTTDFPIDFTELDMALLEVETSNGAGVSLPPKILISTDSTLEGQEGRLFAIGYPARPTTLPQDANGKLRMDVVERLRELFGQSYGQKYLSPGTISKRLGTIDSDTKNWVFAHDATTLGGYSGSPIFLISNGPLKLVGLHFAGDWLRANYAHGLSNVRSSGAGSGLI